LALIADLSGGNLLTMAAIWTVIGLLAASQAATLAVIVNVGNNLGQRIDGLGARLDGRIDGLSSSLGSRIDALAARVDHLSESLVRHSHEI
jgi:hypothetical protein